MSLRSLKYVEDKKLLSGHICKFLGNFDKAQVTWINFTINFVGVNIRWSSGNFTKELYLDSNEPIEALYMRQDLLQWDIALQLATNLAPDEIPRICKEYGQQLELT